MAKHYYSQHNLLPGWGRCGACTSDRKNFIKSLRHLWRTMGNMTQSTLQIPQTLDCLATLYPQEASALKDATTKQLFTLKLHLKL